MFKCDECRRHGLVLVHARKKETDPLVALTEDELKTAFKSWHTLALEWVCISCGYSRKLFWNDFGDTACPKKTYRGSKRKNGIHSRNP